MQIPDRVIKNQPGNSKERTKLALLLSVLEQGLIYGIMGLGVYITYKILDFPDLTVDGSFPLGAAIACILISKGIPAILTLPVCFFAGEFVWKLKRMNHVKFKVREILSGIIMMTALYTVNLRIAGRANLPIYNADNIFDNSLVNGIFKGSLENCKTVIVILVITVMTKCLLDWYLSTKSGFLLRAVGDNDTIVTSLGVDRGLVKIVGLSVANALVTLSGCIFAQQPRFFDISVGTGTVVIPSRSDRDTGDRDPQRRSRLPYLQGLCGACYQDGARLQ